jgi:polysaccharide biosynthesis/export protein
LSRFDFVLAQRVLVLAFGLTGVTTLAAAGRQTPVSGQPSPAAAAKSEPSQEKNARNSSRGAQPSAAEDPSTYRIGVEDELQISVWHEAELSMPVQVRSDGMITLPLINDVSAVGLTTAELKASLTEKLSAYVNEPQVTVIVKAIKSRKVFLVGQVAKPGTYILVGKKTALQVILEAGGLGPFAKTGSIVIVRTVDGQQTRLKFNYKKAVSGKGEDLELIPGDMIVIP